MPEAQTEGLTEVAVMGMERDGPTGKTHSFPIPKVLFAWIYKTNKYLLTHLLVLRGETILVSTLQVPCLLGVVLDYLSTLSLSLHWPKWQLCSLQLYCSLTFCCTLGCIWIMLMVRITFPSLDTFCHTRGDDVQWW